MKQLLILFIFSSSAIIACHSSTSRFVPEPDIIERLKYQKAIIDSLQRSGKGKLIKWEKLAGNPVLIPATDTTSGQNPEAIYNVLEDSTGAIVSISECPFSHSGDSYKILTHYFDKEGKTFAWENETNFFGSARTPGLTYETKREFYDSEFRLIYKEYKLVDEKGNSLGRDSCSFPIDSSANLFSNRDKYMEAQKIRTGR